MTIPAPARTIEVTDSRMTRRPSTQPRSVAAYQVSGEFAMIAAAAERGWVDGRRVMLESVTSIARAGAGIVITYAAADLARWIADERTGAAR